MDENEAGIQSGIGTKMVCSLPPPPPIPDTWKQEILSQYELMMTSLSPQSLNGADKGGQLDRRAMSGERMNACNLSNDENAENVEIQGAVDLPSSSLTPLREERIAFSDKYKRFRRKVKITPVRDPHLQAMTNESFHTQSDRNSPQKYNGSMIESRRGNQPLRQHNLISYPNSDTHVNHLQQQPQPQKETYREHRIRKEMEELRNVHEAAAAASLAVATATVDGQTDCETKLKPKHDTNPNENPFKIPKIIKSSSESGSSTIVPKQKETYADYRCHKQMEEVDKRKAATATSPAAIGSEIDEDW